MSEEPNQVITKKNEGRVAAGKRLVEWNRKDKLEKKKNLGKSTSQDDQELTAGPPKSTDTIYIYGAGGSAILLLCLGTGLYFFFQKPPPQDDTKPTEIPRPDRPKAPQGHHPNINDIDIFCMR